MIISASRCLSTFLGDLIHLHLIKQDGVIIGVRGLLNNIIVDNNDNTCLILLITKEGEQIFQIGGNESNSYILKQVNVKSEIDKNSFKIEYNL